MSKTTRKAFTFHASAHARMTELVSEYDAVIAERDALAASVADLEAERDEWKQTAELIASHLAAASEKLHSLAARPNNTKEKRSQ